MNTFGHSGGRSGESPVDGGRSPEQIVSETLAHWIAQDVDACLSLMSESASYTLHLEQSLLPFAGTTTGRDEIGEQLRAMLRDWDYLVFRPGPPRAHVDDANEIHNRVEFIYRHRASGEILSGFFRLVCRVNDGLITEINEYHDAAMVETFVRLVSGDGQDGHET